MSSRSDAAAWILLNTEALVDERQPNASTATALTSNGQPIHITLVVADPPRDSYFCAHLPCLRKRKRGDGGGGVQLGRETVFLSVTYADGPLALLRVSLPFGGPIDHFIYRAGCHPSLRLLPDTCFVNDGAYRRTTVGLVPVGDDGDGEHFALAALRMLDMEETCELHVFRSDRGAWTNHGTVLGDDVSIEPSKVIALAGGGGVLGWVDLRKGVLVCDVLTDDDPNPRLIPLPRLLPCNRVEKQEQRHLQRAYRDVVACTDGTIRCVEMEHCWHLVEAPDVWAADVLYDDTDLPKLGVYEERPRYEYLGWRIITWHRTLSSNCWRRGASVHVDDIAANDPGHAALLLPMAGDGGRGLTLRSLTTEMPSLSVHGGDVVYVVCRASQKDTKRWVMAVDMAKKTVLEVARIAAQGSRYASSYMSCALTKYLKME